VPSKVPFIEAMLSQPDQLALSHSALVRDLAAATIAPWAPGETVGIVAMGASNNTGHALVAVLAAAGFRAVNLIASDLLLAAPGYQPADHYIVVSESGRSPEPIEAARALTAGRRIGISNFPQSGIADVTDVSLGLGGFDDSGIYTVGYTATLMAYALLLDRLGVVAVADDVARIPEIVAEALNAFDAVAAEVGEVIARASAIDIIGRGTSFASASEFALMVREGLRLPSCHYETYEYLHGPMESVTPTTVVVIFGDDRELAIPGDLLDAGVSVVLVTSAPLADIPAAGKPGLTIVSIDPSLSAFVKPIVETVFAQRVLQHAIEHLPYPLEEFRFSNLGTKIDEPVEA
jgi:glucosamine--fructose-6-phosphate aminotransferase (isomerizing)